MIERTGSCSCGSLRATAQGEPVRVSVCHCLDCKKRTGSAFGWQGTWPKAQVQTNGPANRFVRTSDEGYWVAQSFCPSCGSTIFYEIERRPGMISIPAGGFADPDFPAPRIAVYGSRRSPWVRIEAEDLVEED